MPSSQYCKIDIELSLSYRLFVFIGMNGTPLVTNFFLVTNQASTSHILKWCLKTQYIVYGCFFFCSLKIICTKNNLHYSRYRWLLRYLRRKTEKIGAQHAFSKPFCWCCGSLHDPLLIGSGSGPTTSSHINPSRSPCCCFLFNFDSWNGYQLVPNLPA